MTNLLTTLTSLKKAKNELDKIEKEYKALKEEVEKYITETTKPNEKGKYELTCGQYKVVILPVERENVNAKELKERYPEAYKELATTSKYFRTSVT